MVRKALLPPFEVLMIAGLALGGASTLFAAQPFRTGSWLTDEAVVAVMFASGGLCLTGLAGLFFAARGVWQRTVLHPFVLLPLALALWSLAAAPATDFPMASVLGAPQTGEGALWYGTLAAMIAAAMVLRNRPVIWGGLLGWYLILSLVYVLYSLDGVIFLREAVHLPPFIDDLNFYIFNDFFAFQAVPLLVLGVEAWRRQWRSLAVGLGVAGAAMMAISNNQAGMLLATVLLVPFAVWGLLQARRPEREKTRLDLWLQGLAALTALLLPVLVFMAISHWEAIDAYTSLWSRKILYRVLLPDTLANLKAVLLGHGWGAFGPAEARNAVELGIHLVNPEWKDLYRDEFHSHHYLLESAFAAGLPGLVLALAGPAVLPLLSRARLAPAAAFLGVFLAGLQSFWFQLPASLAFVALATAAVAEGGGSLAHWRRRARSVAPILVPVLAVLGIASLLASADLVAFASRVDRIRACLPPVQPTAVSACPAPVPDDPRLSRYWLGIFLSEKYEEAVSEASQTRAAVPSWREQIDLLARAALQPSPAPVATSLWISLVNYYSTIAFRSGGDSLGAIGEEELTRWRRAVEAVFESAPRRVDVANTYLSWLIAKDRSAEMAPVVTRMMTIAPDHPVTLWFHGMLKLASEEPRVQQEGALMLRQSLAANVERFMQVDPDLKKVLLEAKPTP